MLTKRCLKNDLDDCPYRHKVVNYEHWVTRCGKSNKFAEERADYYCLSIPCLYNIELLLLALQG